MAAGAAGVESSGKGRAVCIGSDRWVLEVADAVGRVFGRVRIMVSGTTSCVALKQNVRRTQVANLGRPSNDG